MFEDKLSSNQKIISNDIVYIYEYKNRNNIEYLEDLIKVKVIDVIPPSKGQKEIMVTGLTDNNEKVTGFVLYKKENDFVLTKEGLKYISFFQKNNKTYKCLKKIKDNKIFYKLNFIFTLKNLAEISITLFDDILFLSEEEVELFLKNIKIKKAELTANGINLELNNNIISTNEYKIYLNNEIYDSQYSKQKLFELACNNNSSKNNAVYSFNKSFSLKLTSYEFEEIKKRDVS